MKQLLWLFALLPMSACNLGPSGSQDTAAKQTKTEAYSGPTAEAIFAGGCFWCIESAFEHLDGVVASISGYAGGEEAQPSYRQVASGSTGHREAVLVIYNPEILSYPELVEYFWRQFDPTDAGGSFGDRGFQYSSAIFYGSDEERRIAEKSKAALQASGRYPNPVVTPVLPRTSFYPAEERHQGYYLTNPLLYNWYRKGSGRDRFIERVWGDTVETHRGRTSTRERATAEGKTTEGDD